MQTMNLQSRVMNMKTVKRGKRVTTKAVVAPDTRTAKSFDPANVKLPHTGALINGEWVNADKCFTTYNPCNEEPIAVVSDCAEKEVEAAVAAAREAFYNPESEWAKLGGYQRGVLLNRLADLIEKNIVELTELECLDNGKPYGEAFNLDLPLVVQCYRYYAGWADKIHGSVVEASGPVAAGTKFTMVEKEPVGVVGQIIPWNFPLLMQAWKLAPALACGCTVVLKTAPQTPLSANRIGELFVEAGFPAGAVNIVPGGDETGKLISEHSGFDKIAFTGSTAVGYKILQEAARSHNMKRVTLELGGKSPMIILDDADIDKAVDVAQVGVFLNQGQCCCASSRIFCHESKYDEFCAKIAERAKAKPVVPPEHADAAGLPADAWPQGPQVDKVQFEKVLGLIKTGVDQGATLLAGGKREGTSGYFIEPTVFADVEDDMTIAKEEIFGPVMQVLKYSDLEDAIDRANNNEYGLAGAIISENFMRARAIGKRLRVGTVWVNCYDVFDAALPFGGFKASGIGRELGEACLDNYLEKKTYTVGA